jgi:hypothetical protein
MKITIDINDKQKDRVLEAFTATFPSIEKGLENFIIGFVARYEQAKKQAEIKQEPDETIITSSENN